MRHRHQVVELASMVVPPGEVPALTDRVSDHVYDADDESIVLIDRSRPPDPILPDSAGEKRASRRTTASAVPSSRPLTPHRPSLPWGLGTDGWPRHNSRLVRLFACDPDDFLTGVVGRSWGALSLSDVVRSVDPVGPRSNDGDDPSNGWEWPLAIDGQLQMPYPSPPLDVELRAQPFHDRYCRVDVVLCSRRRWPRRYFDVASRCLTRMHELERVPAGR